MHQSIGRRSFLKQIGKSTLAVTAAGLAGPLACSQKSSPERPNIIFVLVDDMGWSDLGCYGSEIQTPNIDRLAANGLRFTQCYNTAKCFPSRATLLSGVYAQQCGMDDTHGEIKNAVTLGEVLKTAGYRTLASGKHHGTENLYDRGFDHYYGLRDGCCNFWNPGEKRPGEPEPARKRTRHWCDDEQQYHPYTPEDKNFYTTDVFTDKALQWLDEPEAQDNPFFLYLAYTAPHYPLHAWPKDIAKYKGVYDKGYQAIQKERYQRQIDMGLIDPDKAPLPESPVPKPWDEVTGVEREKEILRMQIYAAMLDRVDQNIGRLLNKLEQQGKLDNTLIFFASDNGACAEGASAQFASTEIEDFGNADSYEVVGEDWATVQNTPLRFWKNWTHEGGICTPLVAFWADHIKKTGGFYREPVHFIDMMATFVDLTEAHYPETFNQMTVTPMQGTSILPALQDQPLQRDKPLYWKWRRGGGMRDDDTKAVFYDEKWELYNIDQDRNETNNLAATRPEELESMIADWREWYRSVKDTVESMP
ncbi:sulfatase-like hydrolase/transferase [candidate division KSB1 bacterium]|nr:sulfatase-like hydrolase/transferase [candidate division KSB1 bacterium]